MQSLQMSLVFLVLGTKTSPACSEVFLFVLLMLNPSDSSFEVLLHVNLSVYCMCKRHQANFKWVTELWSDNCATSSYHCGAALCLHSKHFSQTESSIQEMLLNYMKNTLIFEFSMMYNRIWCTFWQVEFQFRLIICFNLLSLMMKPLCK